MEEEQKKKKRDELVIITAPNSKYDCKFTFNVSF
jgi:hypothetical protein